MHHRYLLAAVFVAAMPGLCAAQPRIATDAYLATIRDDGTPPLPRGLAPGERVPAWQGSRGEAPPGGHVRAIAEYEGNAGIMIRWGDFNALHTSMVVPLTTAAPPSDVWVVVSGLSQENSARSVLQGGGADLDRVHFIRAPSDSVWIRDYGPRFVQHEGTRAIVDHVYNRSFRPDDDQVPFAVGAEWSEPVYGIPLVHGGGNFHLFRNRDAFMTRLIANENPGVSEPEILADFRAWEGLDVTLFDPFPSSYDSTQHIDMWMLPLADGKVLVGEYDAAQGGGVPKTVTDTAVAELEGRGYTVYRTPGWSSGGTHYTYANSVIVNQVVLICRFDGYASQNAAALATYQAALPDHTIVPVDCSDIIWMSGAIHCIVMHVPDLLFRDDSDDPVLM